jgi:hypothetical protein
MSTSSFVVEGAQPLRVIDMHLFFRAVHKEPKLLEKLPPQDRKSFERAALRTSAVKKMPPGVRSGREAVFEILKRGEEVPPPLAPYKPLDPEVAKAAENALSQWRPSDEAAVQAILDSFRSGERKVTAAPTLAPEPSATVRSPSTASMPPPLPKHSAVTEPADAPSTAIPGAQAREAKDTLVDPPRAVQALVIGAQAESSPDAAESERPPSQADSSLEPPTQVPTSQPQPTLTPAEPGTQAFNPSALLEVLDVSRLHVASLAQWSREEFARGQGLHTGSGTSKLPPERPRKEILKARTAAPQRSDVPYTLRKPLRDMDAHVRDIVEQVTSNPVWIAAEYVERTGAMRSANDFPPNRTDLLENPELLAVVQQFDHARHERQQAVAAATLAQQKLGAHQRKPRWMRAAQNLMFDRERRLHEVAKAASLQLLTSSLELRARESEAKMQYATCLESVNDTTRAQSRLARAEREAIERPLRNAVLERHRAEEALAGRCAPARVLEAPALAELTFDSTIKVDGFAFAVLRAEDGQRYLLDKLEHNLSGQRLRPGDVLSIQRDEHGSRHVIVKPRSQPEARAPERERGAGR